MNDILTGLYCNRKMKRLIDYICQVSFHQKLICFYKGRIELYIC